MISEKEKSPVLSKNIEAIYPLSPMQQGMLFHSLYAPESGVYIEQMTLILKGDVNVAAFESAWQTVVDRYSILRTLFLWENRVTPLQVVLKQVNLPWNNLNWLLLSPATQQQQLSELLHTQRAQGFQFNRAPLMGCTLIQLTDDTYHFIWNFHHILLDGWCLQIIFNEVLSLYESQVKGEICHLSTPVPYRNYITWLNNQDRAASTEFWRQNLHGFSAPTPLVVGRTVPQSHQQDSNYQKLEFRLSTEVSCKLQALAQQHHLTFSTIIQAAWGLLLSRYSGEPDIVFGVTVSGRPASLSGVEKMVGLFINTLPLRLQISPEQQLISWLEQIQQLMLELQQFSYTPLVEIQSLSEVVGGIPLFESIVVFENYPMDRSLDNETGSLQIGEIESREQTNFPLTVAVEPGNELSVQISYDTVRFAEDTIDRMLGHLQTIFSTIATNPHQTLGELPLLTLTEQHQLLHEWNDTAREYPQNKCIHQLFEEQVAKTPDAIAVVFEEQELTYQQLNQRANQLAHYLQTLGVKPEVLVGICVERSLEMVVGLLGILKAGGAYVPLDPSYPNERLSYMLSDAEIDVLLIQENLLSSLPDSAQVICLDTDWEVIESYSQENLMTDVTTDNLAYVIYTSGSTGQPKGVTIPHRGVNRLVTNTNYINLQEQDVVALASNFSFDATTFEIWGALVCGAKLVVVTLDALLSPYQLADFIQSRKISTLFLTTALFNQIASTVPSAFNSLQQLMFGGEAVDVTAVKAVLKNQPPQRLLHVYGPTESTTFSTWYLVSDVLEEAKTISIGRPIANTQVYILDPQLQPVPIGVAGELHIGGDGLARGYLNRPELTQAKFIPNPFSSDKSARLYKTGDLARYRPDGNIEFLGRIDHQVKIRGFRIELGEIEAVLSNHPQIQQAVVIALEDRPASKRLVAYVVADPSQAPTLRELHQFLQNVLPHYMVPSAFVTLHSLPLTPNGKIDRQSLPTPDPSQLSEVNFVPPRNALEQNLVKIWEEVLEIFPIGVRDNFFEIGGHSLLAAPLMARIHEKFGKSLSLATLFQGPTIEQLAIVLLQQQDVQSWSPLVAIQPNGKRLPLFCVPGGAMDVIALGYLAHHMVAQPFYGLQPKGLDGDLEPHSRVEEMATCYIQALQVVQPQGPYLLAGHSFGSFIIFEMAHQLQEQGHEVALLAMMDELAPLPIFKSVDLNWRQEANGLNEEAKNLTLLVSLMERFSGNNVNLSYEVLRTLDSDAQLNYIAVQMERANLLPPKFGSKHLRGFLNVCGGIGKAFENFLPDKIYPGKITFFRSSEIHGDDFAAPELAEIMKDPALGWRQFCTETVEVHMVPGNHVSMLTEPHVQILAERLQGCIDKALAHHND